LCYEINTYQIRSIIKIMKEGYQAISKLSKQEIVDLLEKKAGITNCGILSDSDVFLLRSGRMCESLLNTNFNKFIPQELVGRVDEKLCKVRLNYVKSIDAVCPIIIRKYNHLSIPTSYMGYELSALEVNQLKTNNRITSIVSIDYNKTVSEGIICIDTDLNMLKFLPIQKLNIPKMIGKNELSEQKIEILKRGYPVLIPDFQRNNGKRFNAIIQLNTDGIPQSKFAISGLDKWIQEQKKQVEKVSKIMDLQFEILDSKVNLKRLKL